MTEQASREFVIVGVWEVDPDKKHLAEVEFVFVPLKLEPIRVIRQWKDDDEKWRTLLLGEFVGASSITVKRAKLYTKSGESPFVMHDALSIPRDVSEQVGLAAFARLFPNPVDQVEPVGKAGDEVDDL